MKEEKIYVVFRTVERGDFDSIDVDYPLAYCKTEEVAKRVMQSLVEKKINNPCPCEEDFIKKHGRDAFVKNIKRSFFVEEEPFVTEV